MPELPDVEIYRRRLDAHGLRKRIDRVHVGDDRLLKGLSPATLRRHLNSRRLASTRRHGKLLFARISGGSRHLVMHFGMTGDLVAYQDGRPPKYSAVVLDMTGGHHLAYTSQRKLGGLELTEDVDDYLADREVGPDALDLDLRAFRLLMEGRAGSVKGTLMNQSVLAGIGNVYSDEILLRARVHPASRTGSLDDSTIRSLHRAMRDVLRKAIGVQAQPDRMPRSFLLPDRQAGARCPSCNGKVEQQRIGGRSARFCPGCQKLYGKS